MFHELRMNFQYCDTRFLGSICYDIVSEPENKGFSLAFDNQIQRYNVKFYRHGMSSLRFMEEPIGLVYASLAFKFGSPLYESIDEKLLQMVSIGLISKFHNEAQNPFDRKPTMEDIGPQVLTMDDLGIGFQFCCIPLTLSAIVFLMELAVFWSKRLGRTLMERLIAIAFVKAYLNSMS